MDIYPPVHNRPEAVESFDRLESLWERFPKYHEMTLSASIDELVSEHESWQEDFGKVREEYFSGRYEDFLVDLSWADLPYRYETGRLIRGRGPPPVNDFAKRFMEQFSRLDTDRDAVFIFPESYVSQFFVIMDVCGRAKELTVLNSLFPDEETIHYMAVFDKRNMDDVLLMHHLLYRSASEDLFGGYSLYGYSLSWYQTHLRQDGIVLRSPYLPDELARFQGNLPFHHNPSGTVEVRRNIDHILECGYCSDELELFLMLTRTVMPFFQWIYTDIALYEEKDGYHSDWRLERTRIRTRLTAEGIIRPKWKHELTLFNVIRKLYPDTLYQYRPPWLGRQSLDMYIPSIATAVEYQGIQHYMSVGFFGGEEALELRKELDETKKQLCEENGVRLIEWPYSLDPTERNAAEMLSGNG